MSAAVFLAGLLMAPAANAPQVSQPVEVSNRWKWRHCTRLSVDAQLRSRARSLEYADVVEKAFADCAGLLQKVGQPSWDDVRRLQDEQTQLIKLDVETFYWDIVAHRI